MLTPIADETPTTAMHSRPPAPATIDFFERELHHLASERYRPRNSGEWLLGAAFAGYGS
jgi:hypothetical protein